MSYHSFSAAFGFRLKVFKLLLHGAPLFLFNELGVPSHCPMSWSTAFFLVFCMFLINHSGSPCLVLFVCTAPLFLHRRHIAFRVTAAVYSSGPFCQVSGGGRWISIQTLGGWQCIHLVLDADVLLICCSSQYYDPPKKHVSVQIWKTQSKPLWYLTH